MNWQELCPSRDEFIAMIIEAGTQLPHADAQNVLWTALGMKNVAWGADHYAGCGCPLYAAGYRRTRWKGPWDVEGGFDFVNVFDRLMSHRVMWGPGMVGIRG